MIRGVEELPVPAAKERGDADHRERRDDAEAFAVGDRVRDRGDEEQIGEELERPILARGEDDRIEEAGNEREDEDRLALVAERERRAEKEDDRVDDKSDGGREELIESSARPDRDKEGGKANAREG